MTNAEYIKAVISDLVLDFMVYDRDEDENLPRFAIEDAIASGEITVDEMVDEFRKHLTGSF